MTEDLCRIVSKSLKPKAMRNGNKCEYFPCHIKNIRILDIATYVMDLGEDEEDPAIELEFLEKQYWLYPVLYTTGSIELKIKDNENLY